MNDDFDFDLDGFMGNLSEDGTSNPLGPPTAEQLNRLHDGDITSPGSWVPADALEALVEERSANPGLDNTDTTKKILEDNAPIAAQSIVNLALYSRSETVRLRASQYVVDTAIASKAAGNSLLEQFFTGIEDLANEGKS